MTLNNQFWTTHHLSLPSPINSTWLPLNTHHFTNPLISTALYLDVYHLHPNPFWKHVDGDTSPDGKERTKLAEILLHVLLLEEANMMVEWTCKAVIGQGPLGSPYSVPVQSEDLMVYNAGEGRS